MAKMNVTEKDFEAFFQATESLMAMSGTLDEGFDEEAYAINRQFKSFKRRYLKAKKSLGHEPSDEFKKQMILSEHSPLRELEFDIKMYGIPYWVSNHFVRHVHAQPFVSTSRPDITGSNVSRHDMRQDDLVNLQLSLNAQEIINISKLRLCNKASKETREIWYKVIDELVQIEPYLASACVPQCVYRGFCPEPKSCGFSLAGTFKYHRLVYIDKTTK